MPFCADKIHNAAAHGDREDETKSSRCVCDNGTHHMIACRWCIQNSKLYSECGALRVMDSDNKIVNTLHCACCRHHLHHSQTKGNGSDADVHVSKGVCGNVVWREFTEDTTFHGLRYIWQQDSSCGRRSLWLCLTLACVSIMLYQIIDRAIYFYQWPVTVNVKINYNDTLEFPTLTFCNQNAFRATAAESIGRYSLISDLYDNIKAFQVEKLDWYNTTNLTIADLYKYAGHTKEDIIISCTWRGEKCGPENFTETATDHGRCFSFNNMDTSPLFVDSPGSEEGLTMTLNIEQYEYMPGPNDAAGIKILLHHRYQFPNVKELGLVLSAGTHSLVGMKMVSVENLPKPHGQCSSQKPQFYKKYSVETCAVECITNLLIKRCGCRLYHMPDMDGTHICTLREFFFCYRPNIGALRIKAKQSCICPVPCHFFLFEPSVSYATSSPLVTDRFLASANRSKLKAKYDAARDVTHRLRPERRDRFYQLVANLRYYATKLERLIMNEIEDKLIQQHEAVHQVSDDVEQIVNETEYLYRYQEFIVRKDFTRARNAMDERTFSIVAFAMQEFVFNIESSLRYLAGNDSDVIKKVIYMDLIRQLDGRVDITKRAYQNYTEFHSALETGEPIFNYKFKKEQRMNSKYIVPVPMFHAALNMSWTIKRRTKILGTSMLVIIDMLNGYKDLANETFTTGVYNQTKIYDYNVQYLYHCRHYLQSRDQFLYEVPTKIESLLAERAYKMAGYKHKFIQAKNNILMQLRGISRQAQTLSDSHNMIKTGLFTEIVHGIHLAEQFLNGTVSMKDVARQFLTDEIHETKNVLRVFFNEVRSRGYEVYDLWTEMQKSAIQIWSLAIDDTSLHMYYKFTNNTKVLVNKTKKLEEISKEFERHRHQLDFRKEMRHMDSEFLEALAHMLKAMSEFKATGELDAQFLKDNVLQMSIFYRELNFEQITQQSAYDIFALLCDIGGSMGLFVGASVMSIFEIVDLIGFTYMERAVRRART